MVVLLLLDPDFGAAVVIMVCVLGMLFLAGVRFFQYALMVLVCVGAGAMVLSFESYRVERLKNYINPFEDPFGPSYQLVQSLIAYGQGKLWGVGLGNSIQKLFYLPEAHTDFVFSVFVEEFGLMGNLTVIGLFLVLVVCIFQIGKKAEQRGQLFASCFSYGTGILFGLQAYINMGVSSGLLPTTGLTLPLMSYGGSSLLVSCILIGIILRINKENSEYDAVSRPGTGDGRRRSAANADGNRSRGSVGGYRS